MALTDAQLRLLEELTGPDGVIDGKLRGLVFPIWRARRHPAANLLLQYARVGCPVSVGRDLNPDEIESSVTKGPIHQNWKMMHFQKSKLRHRKKQHRSLQP